MTSGAGQTQARGGGLWGNADAFQNPHGDFAPEALAPRVATPPSEESIATLMVSALLYEILSLLSLCVRWKACAY